MSLLNLALVVYVTLIACGDLQVGASFFEGQPNKTVELFIDGTSYSIDVPRDELDANGDKKSFHLDIRKEVTFILHRRDCQPVIVDTYTTDRSVFPPFNSSIPTKILIVAGADLATRDVDSIMYAKNHYLSQDDMNIVFINFSDKLFKAIEILKNRKRAIVDEMRRRHPNVTLANVRKALSHYFGGTSSLVLTYTSHVLELAHVLEYEFGVDMDDLEIVVFKVDSWFVTSLKYIIFTCVKVLAWCEFLMVLFVVYKKMR